MQGKDTPMVVETRPEEEVEIPPELRPRVNELITEDDTPVDNIFSEKQQRLLVEALYSSWQREEGRPFLAMANVGMFAIDRNPAVVPDTLLSLDVRPPADPWKKGHRSYFFWLYGKPPELVIEVVSNREGGELSEKLSEYARMRVAYYVVFDPEQQLGRGKLNIFGLHILEYKPIEQAWFPGIELGLTLWEGQYEDMTAIWLRWCDAQGQVVPTGAERAEAERERAEAERERAEAERERAEAERERAEAERERTLQALSEIERLKAQLRAAGIDPEHNR